MIALKVVAKLSLLPRCQMFRNLSRKIPAKKLANIADTTADHIEPLR
jgi:hypothetical protein